VDTASPATDRLPRTAARLLEMASLISTDEFSWQDGHYRQDSSLGRELLYLLANDEWIRTTTEVIDVSHPDLIDTTITIDADLTMITHEAFRDRTGRISLPVFVPLDQADRAADHWATISVTDGTGVPLTLLPAVGVRHQIASALADLIITFAVSRLESAAVPVRLPPSGRDQRLVLAAALFRLLSDEPSPRVQQARPTANRLSFAKDSLHYLLRPLVRELVADQADRGDAAAVRQVFNIVDALASGLVIAIGVDRQQSALRLNVSTPQRHLTRTITGSPLHRLRLLRPKAQLRVDLLQPTADADRRIQVNLPPGVAVDRRTRPPVAGLYIESGPPAVALALGELVEQLRHGGISDPIQRGLADLAITKTDILARILDQHLVLSDETGEGDAILTATEESSREPTAIAGGWLSVAREALVAMTEDAGPAGEDIGRLAEAWDKGGLEHVRLLRAASAGPPTPRAFTGRADMVEAADQRTAPRYARINIPLEVPEASFGATAKFLASMSAFLMLFVVLFFGFTLAAHGPEPDAGVLASVLTLFSVIQAGRLEIPDRSTLRGLLSANSAVLTAASLVPTLLLALAIAFYPGTRAKFVASLVFFVLQTMFLLTTLRGPLAPGAGANEPPPRILATRRPLNYTGANVLHSQWWRSITASALVTGRDAHAYLVWERPGSRPRDLAEQPSLHRLLGSAVRPGAPLPLAAALTARVRTQDSPRVGVEVISEETSAAISEAMPDPWPADLLGLLRSGTAREALTFLMFRQAPENWPGEGGVRVPIDTDRLTPLDESAQPLDIWIGMARDHQFGPMTTHPLVTLADRVRDHGLQLRDIQFPAPPPSAGETIWARLCVGIHDSEMGRLGPFLRETRSRLDDDHATKRLLIRTTPQGSLHEVLADGAGPRAEHRTSLILASDLDVVSVTPDGGRWRVLAICADARPGIEHAILLALGQTAPESRLAALSHAVFHGTTVLFLLCHQREQVDHSSPLADALPRTGVYVALDEWRTSAELGMSLGEPLLQVHARSQDRPGMLVDLLNAVRPALRETLPDQRDAYGAVRYARFTLVAGRTATAGLSIWLRTPRELVADLALATYGQIERDVLLRTLAAAVARQPGGSDGAPENTMITVYPMTV
jgi:hypothetical protein